jgi:hypothetical protein
LPGGRLNGKEQGKDLRTMILYRRRSEEKGKPTVYSRYYINNRALENLNVMRKAALHLLRKTATAEKRFSVQRKMVRAAFSDDFLYHALFG